DQVFEMDGALGSKPETPEALREQLLSMNGKAHTFHCGLALVRDQELLHAEVDRARVRFHHLSNSEIEDYVATGEGIGCAGGYRLEEGGVRLIESIEGSHFTVLGLPMLGLIAALRTLDPLTLIRRSQENS
ncbi:MAG: Maf family protein, partial [Salinibacterium sp.]|nr:Maf family protein [Salinibacterium sp.]